MWHFFFEDFRRLIKRYHLSNELILIFYFIFRLFYFLILFFSFSISNQNFIIKKKINTEIKEEEKN